MVFLSGSESLCRFFIVCLYMYCCLRSSYQEGRIEIQLSRGEDWDPVIKRGGLRSSYQEGRIEIPVTCLTLTQCCLFQSTTWISNIICHGLFVFSELRWEAHVRFVDIGGIIDHHLLNFLFIVNIQSNLSYVTFQGNNEIWSYMTGGCLIQV